MIKIPIIIFSKDRPAQLNLLLDSWKLNGNTFSYLENITVLWDVSNEEYENGYKICYSRYPEVKEVRQSDFQQDLKSICTDIKTQHMMFLVDDQILFKYIQGKDLSKIAELLSPDSSLCFSLRLGNNTWQGDGGLNKSPELVSSLIENNDGILNWDRIMFNMYFPNCNYAYPFSVDGHIYKTEILKPMIQDASFSNPNDFEGAINQNNFVGKKIFSYEHSVIVNTPVNRVQDVAKNWFGKEFPLTQEKAIKKYLNGYVLDYDQLDFSDIQCCHQELEMKWR